MGSLVVCHVSDDWYSLILLISEQVSCWPSDAYGELELQISPAVADHLEVSVLLNTLSALVSQYCCLPLITSSRKDSKIYMSNFFIFFIFFFRISFLFTVDVRSVVNQILFFFFFCIPFLALVYSCCYAQLGMIMFAITKHHKGVCKNRSFDPPLIQPDQRLYQKSRSKVKSKDLIHQRMTRVTPLDVCLFLSVTL